MTDPYDNSTYGATGGVYRPDTRTVEEKRRDDRGLARRRLIAIWSWRLRGFLPRGWKEY